LFPVQAKKKGFIYKIVQRVSIMIIMYTIELTLLANDNRIDLPF